MRGIFSRPPILGNQRTRIIAVLSVCAFFFLVAAIVAPAQDCPADKVCISRQAAEKALTDSDTVKAQDIEIKGLKQAIEDMRAELNKMRIEFAEKSGENTALKQNAVSDRAIIDILIKGQKKKCYPLVVLCL